MLKSATGSFDADFVFYKFLSVCRLLDGVFRFFNVKNQSSPHLKTLTFPFFGLTALVNIPSAILSGESVHPHLICDLRGKQFKCEFFI